MATARRHLVAPRLDARALRPPDRRVQRVAAAALQVVLAEQHLGRRGGGGWFGEHGAAAHRSRAVPRDAMERLRLRVQLGCGWVWCWKVGSGKGSVVWCPVGRCLLGGGCRIGKLAVPRQREG